MGRTRTFLDERRENLRAMANSTVNGIDRIEIHPTDKSVLTVHLVHGAPGTPGGIPNGAAVLTKDDFLILGGDRIRGVAVESVSALGSTLTINLNKAGDFSTYILRITRSGFDYILRDIAFGFRAECPEVFDVCNLRPSDTPPEQEALPSDYLAKDYGSFRQQMLDRISTLSPEWYDRNVADIGITLVELIAQYADHLSYRQDVAATEAYLNTARFRTSLKRHSRLLGYDVFDGLSARVFVQLIAGSEKILAPSDIAIATNTSLIPGEVASRANVDIPTLVRNNVQIFEPVPATYIPSEHDTGSSDHEPQPKSLHIKPEHNEMAVHDWGDTDAVLPRGSTEIWVEGNLTLIALKKGDFICLEQHRDSITKRKEDADWSHRQIVRLTEDPILQEDAIPTDSGSGAISLVKLIWHSEDALKFDLAIGRVTDPDDASIKVPLAQVSGNIVLCDHGASLTLPSSAPMHGENLGAPLARNDPEDIAAVTDLSQLDLSTNFRPALLEANVSITHIPHYDQDPVSATALQHINTAKAMPAITIREAGGLSWTPTHSLIDASDDARLFVPEFEADGRTYLRFPAADTYGAEPTSGVVLYAHYRVGRGSSGNIGAEALHHIIQTAPSGITGVRNPMPAFGGALADSFDDIRIKAPQVISQNERAVTAEDYVSKIMLHRYVSAAHVRKIWHGSWHTLFIAVDLVDGLTLTAKIRDQLLAHLEPYRLMGQDIQIEEPNFAPLDVILHICIDSAYLQNDVLTAVRDTLSAAHLPGGRLGFFHPDRLSFGEPIYLSQIYAEAQSVPGVADVKVIRFTRWGSDDESMLEAGVITVGVSEIPVLMNDPNYPERGRLEVQAW